MSLSKRLRSGVVAALLGSRARAIERVSAELKRRLTGKAHEVSAFLQLDDPYSYLLSIYLPHIVESYDVVLRLYPSQALGDEFSPEPGLAAEYAVADCRLLAAELGVPFLDRGVTPVVEQRRALLDVLAADQDGDDFPTLTIAALAGYWRGDAEGVARMVGGAAATGGADMVRRSQEQLAALGHYDSAMLHYGGEWYRGIDRLTHLIERLDSLGLRRGEASAPELKSIRQAMRLSLPATAPGSALDLPSLEMYFSFRSPYSYLAMERTCDLADAYRLTLTLRPVLPMVMRGLPVPRRKRDYIVRDAGREAERHGVAFGRVCDPLGAGVERAMAVFDYARGERREREFMLAACRAIWSEGIDVATDAGMRQVTERVGLFWPEVQAAMHNDDWRRDAEANQDALAEAGLWGVPAFRFGDTALWGQDRIWLLARQIEDRCHDGEGILI